MFEFTRLMVVHVLFSYRIVNSYGNDGHNWCQTVSTDMVLPLWFHTGLVIMECITRRPKVMSTSH